MVSMNKKVMAVASVGGHWVQLLCITKAMEPCYDIVYCSTHTKCATMVNGHEFYQVKDFSRWNVWKLPFVLFRFIRIIQKVKPVVVFTTGAAPGLTALLAAKLCGVKTVWIDSIANIEHLSASGRIACCFADRIYTQWENLAKDKIVYKGNILG